MSLEHQKTNHLGQFQSNFPLFLILYPVKAWNVNTVSPKQGFVCGL